MSQPPDWSGQTDVPHPAAPAPGMTPYPYAYPPGPNPGGYPGGYPPGPSPYGDYPFMPPAVRNGLGVAALVIGIIALVASFSVVGGVLFGLVAVILGLAGRARVRRGEATNGGVALTGIVIGVIAIIAGLAFTALWVGLFRQMGAGDYFDCLQQAGQDRDKVQQCSEEFRQSVENQLTVTRTPPP